MGNEAKEQEPVNETGETQKKSRHRKKQLYSSILHQMEFYFSDSNLTKDRFLSRQLESSSEIDLNVFLQFNKIRKLTANVDDIRRALKKSDLIQVSSDGNRVSRITPVKEKSNVEDCTIYVEKLKADTTHEWLNLVFSEFGNVVYVSIPKYKSNGSVKGFAFIEFEKEQEAQAALEYFENIGCKIPSNILPDQLCSIQTFDEKSEPKLSPDENNLKRKLDEFEDGESTDTIKKAKLEPTGVVSEIEDNEALKKKKLKKEHKKKNFIKESGLQVLSKKEWRILRSKYLNLQRKKMTELKKHLLKAKFSLANYEEKMKKPDNAEQKSVPEEVPPKLEFVEGVIVKLKLSESCEDSKKFKNELKASCSDIKYVDIPNPGSEFIYLRFSNKEAAVTYCSKDSTSSLSVLEGDEEKDYWERLYQTRNEKFQKSKKVRGRDKLLKKANKMTAATHIKFDE